MIYQYREEMDDNHAQEQMREYYVDELRELDERIKEAKKQVKSELAKKNLGRESKRESGTYLRLRPNSSPFTDD